MERPAAEQPLWATPAFTGPEHLEGAANHALSRGSTASRINRLSHALTESSSASACSAAARRNSAEILICKVSSTGFKPIVFSIAKGARAHDADPSKSYLQCKTLSL
jgi:hypothetical protein